MDEQRVLSFLGIAMRAGQVLSGDDTVERAVRSGRVTMVFLDADASGNTRDKYQSLCEAKAMPLVEISADRLGKAIGKPNRMIVAVQKGSFAKQMATLLR